MDPITSFYLSQGVLGATVAICLLAIVFLVRKIFELQKELKEALLLRLQDSKDYNTGYTQTVEKYATLSEKSVQSDGMLMQGFQGLVNLIQQKNNV